MRAKLSSITKVVEALNADEHAVGGITGTAVSGQGYDRCMFIIVVGDISTGGGMSMQVQQSSATGGTYAAVTSASITAISDTTGDNDIYVIDVPVVSATPFLKLIGTAGTASVNAGGCAILYHGTHTNPPTSGAAEVVTI